MRALLPSDTRLHSPRRETIHERGMQLTLTNGMTTHRSRLAMFKIVGIHICACESPMTTIVFEPPVSPSRQILLLVARPRGVHPSGKR